MLSMIFTLSAFSQNSGSYDLTFNAPNGFVNTDISGSNKEDAATCLAIQNDGKIITAGYTYNGTNYDMAVQRFNSDGTPDLSFGSNGIAITAFINSDDVINAVALQQDGKIVVAGYTYNTVLYETDFAVVRYLSNGIVDSTFGTAGKVTTDFSGDEDKAYALCIQDDGKILVAGRSWYSTNYDVAIARYSATGSLDYSFGNIGMGKIITIVNHQDYAYGIAVQPDGKIVVNGCTSDYYSTKLASFVLRYADDDGNLDATFGTGGAVIDAFTGTSKDSYSKALIIQEDNKIVVAGTGNNGTDYDAYVARYETNGDPDNTFGTAGKVSFSYSGYDDFLSSITIQTDKKILLGGYSKIYDASQYSNDFTVTRLDSNGTLDASFAGSGKTNLSVYNFDEYANGIKLQDDGKIVVAGKAYMGTHYDAFVARIEPETITALGDNSINPALSVYPNPAKDQLFIHTLSPAVVSLFNITGELIKTIQTEMSETVIPISELSRGVYMIKINTSNRSTVQKFIKD